MSKEEGNGDGPQDGAGAGPSKDASADIYENHGAKKLVRLVTVMAYMFSVSFVAIVLSAYYLFLWEPPNPKLLRRPVHLASEPEVQFLTANRPTASDEARQLTGGRVPYLPIVSRIAELEDAGDNRSGARAHREKLDESLFLLRNTLVEFLQDRANATESPRWRTGEPLEHGSSGERPRSTRNMKRPFDDDAAMPDSSTISGDEANGHPSAANGSNSASDLRRTDDRSIRDPAGTRHTDRGKHGTNGAADRTANTTTPEKRASRIGRSRYFETHPSGEKRSNADGAAEREDGDSGAARSGAEALNSRQREDPANFGASRDRSGNSGTGGSIYSGRLDESPARPRNLPVDSEDTQMEGMTSHLVTMANTRSSSEEGTTERKDLFTVLMNTTFSSTRASPLSTSGGLGIDTSREGAETTNATDVKIN